MKIKVFLAIVAAITMLNLNIEAALAQSYLDREGRISKSSSQPLNDALIATKIRAELTLAEDIKSGDIDVEVIDGVVFLTGTQPSEALIRKAEEIAVSIKHVKEVDSSGLIVAEPVID